MLPMISVLIPSYNHARYLRETIESVWQQTYSNIELVVVDDASTDGSVELLRELKAISPISMQVHFNEKNEGSSATVNKAFSFARGELISFFASDDIYAPSAFEDSVDILLHDPDVQVVFADGLVIDAKREFGCQVHGEETKQLLRGSVDSVLKFLYTHSSPFFLQTALIRKSLIDERDPSDNAALADDWLTNIRIFQKIKSAGKIRFVDRVVFYYRVHGENLHRNTERHIALKKQMVERYTPSELRREAKANIYWEIGESLAMRRPWRALAYMVRSQLTLLQPALLKNTLRKVITKAVGR